MIILDPLLQALIFIIDIYWWVVILAAIMSWLIAFHLVNTYNPAIHFVANFLFRATEPALRPIRRFVPHLGGLDISPVILLVILFFLRVLLTDMLLRLHGLL
jgi:YggT family protein